MDLDAIIASINKKLKTFNATPLKLEELDLSEAERSFDQQYKPGNVLIVYGTLAPGRPNYPVIEHIKGNWQQGIVRGKLIKEGWGAELGYYAFKHVGTEEQEERQQKGGTQHKKVPLIGGQFAYVGVRHASPLRTGGQIPDRI